MAGMVLGTVGAVVGGMFGPMGAQVGWMLGSMVGNAMDPQDQGKDAPQLSDLKITSSAYARPQSYVWGTVRKAGDVLWSLNRVPHAQHAQQQGKGGGDGPVSGWTYSLTFAIGLCKASFTGRKIKVRRMWANTKLVYDVSNGNTGFVGDIKFKFTLYGGGEDQLPDPIMESHLGVGNTPAYQDWAYIVYDDLDLSQFQSDTIPNFEYEIVNSDESEISSQSTYYETQTVVTGMNKRGVIYNPINKYVYSAESYNNGTPSVRLLKIDPTSNQVIASNTINNVAAIGQSTSLTILINNFGDLSIPVNVVGDSNDTFLVFNKENLSYVISNETSNNPATYNRNGYRFLTADKSVYYGFSQINDQSGNWNILKGSFASMGSYIKITDAKYNMSSAYNFAMSKEDTALYYIAHDLANSKYYVAYYNMQTGEHNQEWFSVPTNIVIQDLYFDYKSGSLFVMTYDGNIYGNCTVYKVNVDDLTFKTKVWKGSVLNAIEEQRVFMTSSTNNNENYISYLKWDSLDTEEVNYSLIDTNGISIGNAYGCYIPDNDYSLWFGVKNPATINAVLTTLNNELYTEQHKDTLDAVIVAQLQAKIANVTELLNTNNQVMFIHYNNRISDGSYDLGEMVKEISVHAGMKQEWLDITDLNGIQVRGYATTNRTQARALLQQLAPIYFFDAVESNRKLKFVRRGKDAIATIPYSDLGVQDFKQGMNFENALQHSRTQELELPKIANIVYLDYTKDKQQNNQQAIRKVKDTQSAVTYEVAIVLTADEAKNIIQTIMDSTWASREKFQWSTNMKYCYVEPTDVVNIVTAKETHRIRVTKKTESNGIIKFEGESDIKTVYSQFGTGALTSAVNSGVTAYSPSELTFLDMPILTETDNDAGVYFTVSRTNHGMKWQGAEIEYSQYYDGQYVALNQVTKEGFTGVVQNVINSFDKKISDMDSMNYIDVFTYKTLSSVTFDELLNFSNLIAVGGEYIQFMTVEPLGENKYRLWNLLRGRFNTEQFMSSHVANEKFVLFNLFNGTIGRMLKDSSYIHSNLFYKATTYTKQVSDSVPFQFNNQSIGLKPYPVCNITYYREVNNDLKIKWFKRVRGNQDLKDYIDVNDIDSDSYEIDIFKDGSVIRTIKTTDLFINYTSSQQVEDFGSIQSSITLSIYKMNAIIGRGIAKTLTV